MKKKKNKIVICQYCGGNGKLESSLKVYQQDFGYIWICENYPSCDAYVGCHKDTKSPKGWMANEELRIYRKEAHKLFDKLWSEKIKRLNKKNGINYKIRKHVRSTAYAWLAKELQIESRHCHIGMFDIEMCKRAIEV